MTPFRTVLRAAAVAALVGACLAARPALRVEAGSGCIDDYFNDQMNPFVSRSDALAQPDIKRVYADIRQVCGSTGPVDTFTLTMGTSILSASSFPTIPGDVGLTYRACSDATGAIANLPVQVGVGHRGEPVFAGPYPPQVDWSGPMIPPPLSQGWMVCTYLTVQLATPDDYGVEIVDPTGDATVFHAQQLDGMPAPQISGNALTLSLPTLLCYHVDPPAPPMVGQARDYCEPFMSPSSATDVVANTSVEAEASLPAPLCLDTSPPGVACNGNQALGPFSGIAGLEAVSDWAPGRIQCTLPGDLRSCTMSGTPVGSPTAAVNGYDLGLLPLPPGAQAVATCVNPITPGPGTLPVENPWVTCAVLAGTYTYSPCQAGNTPGGQDQGDLYSAASLAGTACSAGPTTLPYEYVGEYGRITPYMLPPVEGFTVGPGFVPDGWNF